MLHFISETILRKKGVTQGGSFAMVAYGLVRLPIIYQLKETFMDANQTWYVENTSVIRLFNRIQPIWERLSTQESFRGYFTELAKFILVTGTHNI